MSSEFLQGRVEKKLSPGEGPSSSDKLYAGTRLDEKTLTHRVFQHCTFSNVSFFNATLTRCIFLNCAFLSCYFRRSHLDRCEFTASKFINCSFPEYRLRIDGCDFSHADFRGCFIPFKHARPNLPVGEHNLRDELASALGREAQALGYTRDARQYRRTANRAREQNNLAIVLQREAHYRSHRYNFSDRVIAAGALVRGWVNRMLWGHGENGLVLLWWYAVVGLVVFPGLLWALHDDLSKPSGGTVGLGDTEFLSLQNLINGSSISPVEYHSSLTRAIATGETVIGLLFVGLFIVFLLRWIERR